MKKKIMNILFNILRNHVKKTVTGDLGKVVEDDNFLTTYVSKNKFEEDKYNYHIYCNAMSKNNKELSNVYKLNKPKKYVFNNLEFNKIAHIYGYDNCEIIFKNCRFNSGLTLKVKGKCTLENSTINNISGYLSIFAKDIILKGMNIYNYFSSQELKIKIIGDNKLSIINSKIGKTEEKTTLNLMAGEELNVVNSVLSGDTIQCETGNLITDEDSIFDADNKLIIEAKKYNKINVSTSHAYINSKHIIKKDRNVKLEKIDDSLKIKRLQLIDTLKLIKEKCEKENEKKLETIKENLDNRPISKVLK